MQGVDVETLRRAKKDLSSKSPRIVLDAAKYFFLDGAGVDESNSKTFTALCIRSGINADVAAKNIWNRLPKKKQKKIIRLLDKAGYKTDRTVSSRH